MLFVVYQKMHPDDYPVMLGVFLMKVDAEGFIRSQPRPSGTVYLEEVNDIWKYWKMIREKLNEQVYRSEGEY